MIFSFANNRLEVRNGSELLWIEPHGAGLRVRATHEAAMPAAGTKTRLVIVNRDVPNMIAAVTKILGDAGVNIQSFKNESNGKIGYNLVDLACEIDDGLVKSIEAAGDVLKVRVIKY